MNKTTITPRRIPFELRMKDPTELPLQITERGEQTVDLDLLDRVDFNTHHANGFFLWTDYSDHEAGLDDISPVDLTGPTEDITDPLIEKEEEVSTSPAGLGGPESER